MNQGTSYMNPLRGKPGQSKPCNAAMLTFPKLSYKASVQYFRNVKIIT